MKSSVISNVQNHPFEEVYEALKVEIVDNGFLLLHEIDTQKIVAAYGVKTRKLKQLLFFHPRYIDLIMSQDHLAINDIPLKIVIHELEDGRTNLSFQNPLEHLKGYELTDKVALELSEFLKRITKF